MRGRTVVTALTMVSLSGAAACALVAGIEQPTDRAADAAAEGSSAEGGDATSPGADAQPNDAAKDSLGEAAPADGCADGGKEICNDGIDNDCNGLVDCADPACTTLGYTCIQPVPTGWTYDAIDMTAGPAACPAGNTTSHLVASASGDPDICGCSCSVGAQPGCLTGTLYALVGASSCTPGPISFVQSDGGCDDQVQTGSIPSNLSASPLDAGGTCIANSASTRPLVSETDWPTCSGPLGAGCDGGQVCAFAGHPFTACVVGSADAGCPSGYSTRSTAGTAVSDTRDCTGCTCQAVPTGITCASASLSFWTSTACTGAPTQKVAIDGTCHGTSGGPYGSFQYSATASGTASCGIPTGPSTPTGGVTVTGQVTACCAP